MKVGVCGESWECVVWWEWMVREWRVCGENGGWGVCGESRECVVSVV